MLNKNKRNKVYNSEDESGEETVILKIAFLVASFSAAVPATVFSVKI